MSSFTPRETTGALPEWNGIQKTDKNMIIDPILQQYRAVMRAALQEHMNLVTSQYMTGYARASAVVLAPASDLFLHWSF